MKESAIIIFLPESEISDNCGNGIADLISTDTGWSKEHITLHQINAKELVSGIAAVAKVMHHVQVEKASEVKVDPSIKDALMYILKKYNNNSNGKIDNIEDFRVRFIIDAQNAFNSNRKSTDLTNFKNAVQQIATHQGGCAAAIRSLFPNSGLTREHLEAILSVHNYYTKSYV